MPNPLALKMARRSVLTDEAAETLRRSCERTRRVGAREDIARQGEQPRDSVLLLEGLAARHNVLEDGRRQITSLHVPGDFCDLHSFVLPRMDHGVSTLSACTIALVPHEDLRRITDRSPELTRALWFDTLVDAAIHRAWLTSMGRRAAPGRIAHLMCELFVRLEAVGETVEKSFTFPITQAELGDIVGLSTVHTNRSLKQLRAEELLSWTGARMRILDWDGLRRRAEFDPTYLYLGEKRR